MPNFAPEMPRKLAHSAFKLFSRHGFSQVNVATVAADLGVTKGSVYWHYRSQKELIQAACAYCYRTYQRRINEEIAPLTDPGERLDRALRLAVRSCLMDKENHETDENTDDRCRCRRRGFYVRGHGPNGGERLCPSGAHQ